MYIRLVVHDMMYIRLVVRARTHAATCDQEVTWSPDSFEPEHEVSQEVTYDSREIMRNSGNLVPCIQVTGLEFRANGLN